MSTGAGCRFTQIAPDEWQYELQHYPYGMTPDYDTYGPFKTFAAAEEHLTHNFANPGGFMVRRLAGFECEHEWVQEGIYDACPKCGRQRDN